MEPALSADEAPAASARLKQEGGSTPPGDGRGSPPPNCAICLGACQNKSFTDSCLHQFCFNCLLTWSKIKAECPLCKQLFKSIIHNVRSNHQYEEYLVEQRQAEVEALPVDDIPEPVRRFRYRTTITFPRSEGSAIQRLLVRHVEGAPPPRPDAYAHRRPFRQTVYRHNLWARLLPDFTGRLRECTPEFYRENEAQRYRLVPWLTRELDILLSANHGHIAYVMARILDLLPVCSLTSPEFRENMLPFFGDRTEHFLHELLCFASTPYDMLGYDRNVQYGPDPRLGANFNHVISSTESDSDSDVVVVPSPAIAASVPQFVVPIETISHSDTEDSSSEVIMTGYIKPPQDRTPEVVDLLASDSDVLVQENSPPASTSREMPSASALVKLTLSRRERPPDTDSDSDYEPRRRPKRKLRSQDSRSTVSERNVTQYSSDTSWNPVDANTNTTASPAHSWESNCSSYTPPLEELPKEVKPKGKKRQRESKEERKKPKKRRERSRSPKPKASESPDEDRQRNRNDSTPDSERQRRRHKKSKKSKRSRREWSEVLKRVFKNRISDRDRPGTSGLQREGERRLRSVVCTPTSTSTGRSECDVTSSETRTTVDNNQPSTSQASTSHAEREKTPVRTNSEDNGSSSDSLDIRTNRAGRRRISSSESEDDLPLNLTMNLQCKSDKRH